MMSSIGLVAFNIASWCPTQAQFGRAMACIQPDERERIRKFRYRSDAKASLIGRLLIRSWIWNTFKSNSVTLSRTERGRPFWEGRRDIDFNVSHAGDYSVFVAASGPDSPIGVDVMPLSDKSREKDVVEFFRLMRRQFTDNEWRQIESPPDPKNRLAVFFRLWCLKESYIKAKGTGLGINLQTLSFKLNSGLLKVRLVSDTEFYLQGEKVTSFQFNEILVDDDHCCAVCHTEDIADCQPTLRIVNFDEVIDGLSTIDPEVDYEHEWRLYQDQVASKPF